MENSTNVYHIKPLKGVENYAVWKIKMEDILMHLDLLGYIDGTIKATMDQASWDKKDWVVLSAIRL